MNVVKRYNLTQYDVLAPSAEPVAPVKPTITYAVKTASGIKPDVSNGKPTGTDEDIVAIKIGVDYGEIEYRVHCVGEWLPVVSGNDWNDYENGYAGDDVSPIDAIQIYYYSDLLRTDVYEAVYAVRIGDEYLPSVHDTDWEDEDGDNTAGLFDEPFNQIMIVLDLC